jgi:hypothetical protein
MALTQDERAEVEAAIFDINAISHKLSELLLEQSERGAGGEKA